MGPCTCLPAHSPAREGLTKSDFELVTSVGKLGWDHALLFVIKAEKSIACMSLSHAPAWFVAHTQGHKHRWTRGLIRPTGVAVVGFTASGAWGLPAWDEGGGFNRNFWPVPQPTRSWSQPPRHCQVQQVSIYQEIPHQRGTIGLQVPLRASTGNLPPPGLASEQQLHPLYNCRAKPQPCLALPRAGDCPRASPSGQQWGTLAPVTPVPSMGR